MKALKKLSCLLLAVLLLMSLSVTAFAADGDVTPATDPTTITITKALSGQTYSLYRVLDLVSYNKETGEGLYEIDPLWKDFFTAPGVGASYVGDAGIGGADNSYVKWIGGETAADVQAFAKAALEFAKAHTDTITPVQLTAEINGTDNIPVTNDKTVTFTKVPLGYYVIDSTAGSMLTVDANVQDVEGVVITDKNDIPSIDKKVHEDSALDGTWEQKNHDDIDKEVFFKTEIPIEVGAQNYVMHDVMDKVLDWTDKVTVTIDEVEQTTGWELVTEGFTDGCTFEVRFSDEFVTNNVGKTIVVTYSAIILPAARINIPMTNDVDLTYGDNNRTEKSHTDTYTYGFDLYKAEGTNNPDGTVTMGNPLANAEFQLQNKDGLVGVFTVAGDDPVVATFTGEWVAADTEVAEGKTTTIVTPASGKISFKGLDADKYVVVETKAPDGFNKADPFNIEIRANAAYEGELYVMTEKDPAGEFQVQLNVPNYAGLTLPETGGIGTTIFYVVGGVLVAAALVLLITKKRVTKES